MSSTHSDYGLDWAQRRVRAFHEACQHPVADLPEQLPQTRVDTRTKWMRQELEEFQKASTLTDQADAIIDLIYFALGTLVELGVDGEPLFDIVHRANMDKRSADGRVLLHQDGKVGKRSGWVTPEPEIERSILATYAGYPSIIASRATSAAACVAMAANALGMNRLTLGDIESLFPRGTSSIEESSVLLGGGSFDRFLQSTTLRDDYLHCDVLDEATFHNVLDETLGTYRSVIIGASADIMYRGRLSGNRFVLIGRKTHDKILIVDPSAKPMAHLQTAHIDDVLAGIRNVSDGIHRIRSADGEDRNVT